MNSEPLQGGTFPDFGAEALRRVLVVSESRLQRRILSGLLMQSDYDVIEASSAEDAMEICCERMPDVIICDWVMQGTDGLGLCETVRGVESGSYTYFILLTSQTDKSENALGLDAGADDFLSKPVHGSELRARVDAGMRIVDINNDLAAQNRKLTQTLRVVDELNKAKDRDLLEARKLQQSLVPVRHKQFESCQLSLLLRPSNFVGGDLVGFFPAGDRHLGFYALDVSGHGISSALMTARLAGYLSPLAMAENGASAAMQDGCPSQSPLEIVQALNRRVLGEMETEHFFTMILGDIDLKTGHVRLCQAGHPHPLVQRANGEIEQTSPGGFPVGLLEDAEFATMDIQLCPGDRLMLPSDGITECTNAKGVMLGEEGLAHIVDDLDMLLSSTFLEAFMWRLSEYAGTSKMQDDVSLVMLDFSGS